MSTPRLARLAATRLARDNRRSAISPASRATAVAALEDALRRRAARRKRHLRVGWGAVAVAAAVASLFAAQSWVPSHGPPVPVEPSIAVRPQAPVGPVAHVATRGAQVVREAATSPLVDGTTLRPGDRLLTAPSGGSVLDLPTGTGIVVGERADLGVESVGASQLFLLTAGSIDAHVAKLAPGERFVVRTPDAEVEVRGTRFRVTVVSDDADCGSGTLTRLQVQEGLVAVRHGGHEVLVPASSAWPPCASPAIASGAPSVAAPPPIAPRTAPSASASSTLAEQNALFARAMAAERAGEGARAAALFEQLLATYPASPLAESASVERMRSLSRIDRGRAADAARDYLRRYPTGSARAEALALAGS